jgi:hypothetical protein
LDIAWPFALENIYAPAQVIIRPPLAWALAVIAGLALNWLVPLPFLPADLPAGWLGAMVFVLALTLVAWAIVTITRAGSNVPTNLPTTTGRERTVPLHAQPHLPLTSTLRDAGIRQEPDHAHLFPGM